MDEGVESEGEEDREEGDTTVRPPYSLLLEMWKGQKSEDSETGQGTDEEELPWFLASGGIALNAYYIDGTGQVSSL